MTFIGLLWLGLASLFFKNEIRGVTMLISDAMIDEITHTIETAIQVAIAAEGEWCSLLGIFLRDEGQKPLEIVAMPCLCEKPGELVRVHVHMGDWLAGVAIDPILLEIEPRLIGSGKAGIAFEKQPDGFKIVRRSGAYPMDLR